MPYHRTIASLKATLNVAIDDACSPGWLCSLEQAEGGNFAPKRELESFKDVKGFLLEFDLHMNTTLPKVDKERFIQLTKTAILQSDAGEEYNAIHRAKCYNYTSLLPKRLVATARTVSVLNQTELPQKRASPPSEIASGTNTSSSTSVEVATLTASNKSNTKPSSSSASTAFQRTAENKRQKLSPNMSD